MRIELVATLSQRLRLTAPLLPIKPILQRTKTMNTRTFDYRGYFVMYERMMHNGALCFDAVNDAGERIKRQFYGYTVAEAKQAIKQAITEAKG